MSKQSEDIKTKQSMKKVWSNNWFLIKLCFQASPIYIITLLLDAIRNQVSIFFEHTYGIGYILEAAEFNYPFRKVATFIIVLAILITLGMVFTVIAGDLWAAKGLPKVRRKIKMILYEKAKEQDLQAYDNPEYYNELMLVMTEADKQIDRCVQFLRNTVSGFATFITAGIFFLYKDKTSILFVLLSFFLSFCFNQIYNKLSFQIRIKRSPYERKIEYVRRVFYLADYAKEIRLNPEVSDSLLKEADVATEDLVKVEKSYLKKRFVLSFMKNYVSNDFISDVVYIGYLTFKAAALRSISYSSVVILYGSFGRLKHGMRIFTDVYPFACETSLYVQKIRDFIDMTATIQSDRNLEVKQGAKAIDLKRVTFQYNEKSQAVIEQLSMSIKAKEKIAVVGYNGAGKTTLMKLIMRLYDPTQGEIIVDQQNIKDYNVEEYRKSIGTVFQDFMIFAGTVKENVLLDVPCDASDSKIRTALDQSGFGERLRELKYGLDTELTTEFAKEGVNLSGGEAQKLAIGRVFYKDAGLIILDEPSSALDPIAEYQLNHSMLEAAENKTVIFISHRLSTTRLADRIIMLEQGEIVEEGTHEELLQLNGKYAQMWKAQAGQYIAV